MKNNKAFTLIEVLVVIIILALMGLIAYPAFQKLRGSNDPSLHYYNDVYQAWCNGAKRNDLSYEDWLVLYQHGLLTAVQINGQAKS